ncbi:MAG: hypothetical protein KZQ70_08205 [gamma proteobacterium symbiont of Lucinoma myriamae]|nr:hypothetical protein [gamma proteobacterium symbiont of Lucinoma myriamae]
MQERILIIAEVCGGEKETHLTWLFHLLQIQLKSCLDDVDIIYGSFDKVSLHGLGLIIGFEFSAKEKVEIEKNKINYLDLRIHPVRFMDDVFFSFDTNSDAIWTKLQQYKVDDRLCRLQASMVKATVVKIKKDHIVVPNSLLLIGQTEADMVVFDGEKYLSLLDRIDEIKKIAADYEHVYFKAHPYAKNNRYILRELRKELGEVQSTRDNIYHLLANDGIRHVAALNSSVLYEALYFNKETTFLFKPTFTDKQISIYGDYFNGDFWSDILSPVFLTIPSSLALPFQASRLRKAVNDFWGYNEIADEIVLMDIIKSRVKRLLSRYIR